jgi:hypothetical protein
MVEFPLIVYGVGFLALWLAAQTGAYLRRWRPHLEESEHEDLGVILTATLTLLGLIIGFTFSMAVSRYDQRKVLESAEANAIGTAYLRMGLLPKTDASKARELLGNYLSQRVLFYSTRGKGELQQVEASTDRLQTDLWISTQTSVGVQPTAMMIPVVSSINDVLNSRGYTQAAWWNTIPPEAWELMGLVAFCGNVLLGYNSRNIRSNSKRLFLLPLMVSTAFFMIADLDSPRNGIINVVPQNLKSVSTFIREQQAVFSAE